MKNSRRLTDEDLRAQYGQKTPTPRKLENLLVHRVDEYWGNPGSTGSEGAAR